MIPHQLATSIAAYDTSKENISPVHVFDAHLFHLLKRCVKPVDKKVILKFFGGDIALDTKHLKEGEAALLLAALKDFKERLTSRGGRFNESRQGLSGTVTLFCWPEGGIDRRRYMVGDRLVKNGILLPSK